MAAKLKKRALAEYQTQTQPAVEGEPSKRLRLVTERSSSSSKEEEPDSLLTVGPETGDKEVVEHVVNFTAELTQQHSPDVLGHALRRVVEALTRVEDACVRARLVQAWGDILATGRLEDTQQKVEEVLVIMNESSSRVTAAWLAALAHVATKVQLGRAVRHKLFRAGELLLHSTPHPLVHCKALLLLSNLAEAGDGAESKDLSTQALNLCGAYSMAQDARVRTAAFHALLTIHKRGVKLDVSMYPVFCTALTDDYEGVRCEALTILAAMAETDPEYQVEVDTGASRSVVGGQTIRLVDDVFSRTCQAINDVRETVRVLAARLIGEMKGVSQGYLEQTLDKKLMSNMRTKRNAHERMAGLVSSGEWSSGSR